MTEIYYRNLADYDTVKRIEVPTDQAEEAIEMIRESDTLEFTGANPI